MELFILLFSAAQAYLAKNELEKAKGYYDEVIQMLETIDVPYMNAWAYVAQANMAAANQDWAEAEKYQLLAAEANDSLGDQRLAATTCSTLAHLYRRGGRFEEALALYRQTILAWQEQGHQSAVAHQIECFAYIAITKQQYHRAAQLLGAARKTRERLNSPSTDLQEIDDLRQAMNVLKENMGAVELNRMIDKGERMSLDVAVAFVLAEE